MTDTTDIKSLREGLAELLDHVDSYGGKCWLFPEDVRSIISSLDQLEADRQRADANAQEIRKLEFQWEHRAPTQWAYDQACTALHAQRDRAEKAEAEIAGMREKQAKPVIMPITQEFNGDEWYWKDSVIKLLKSNGFNLGGAQ